MKPPAPKTLRAMARIMASVPSARWSSLEMTNPGKPITEQLWRATCARCGASSLITYTSATLAHVKTNACLACRSQADRTERARARILASVPSPRWSSIELTRPNEPLETQLFRVTCARCGIARMVTYPTVILPNKKTKGCLHCCKAKHMETKS